MESGIRERVGKFLWEGEPKAVLTQGSSGQEN